jgi:hypothetical protein
MSLYQFTTLDRGPEPVIRERSVIADENNLYEYRLVQDDVQRITGFVLETVAQRLFGNCDLAWILSDVNDDLKEAEDYSIGDVINVPLNWQDIRDASDNTYSTARARGV